MGNAEAEITIKSIIPSDMELNRTFPDGMVPTMYKLNEIQECYVT